MNTARHILTAVSAGVALWLMVLAGGLLYAMFSTTGPKPQRTDALWGAVYFKTTPSPGGVMMHLGLGDMQTALLLLIACLAACAVVGLAAHAHERRTTPTPTPDDPAPHPPKA